MTGPAPDPQRSRPLVCALAYDGLCTFELSIAVEVFGLPRPEFEHWYRFKVVALEPGPLRATGGITIAAEADPGSLEQASLVIVPGWRGARATVPETVRAAVLRAHAAGARIASICSGVFVLAAAGLLEGRRATTHWHHVEALRAGYPGIEVDGDVLYVDEGDVLSSAGSAAGIDLCLHIVRRDFGHRIANMVARRLVVPAHREGGQRQLVPRPVPRPRDGRLAPLLDRVRTRLDEEWPLSRLASEAGMSTRTLIRHVRQATGLSPQAWVNAERVAQAVSLIEGTNASLEDIAASTGFGSAEAMRRHVRLLKGCPPSAFRPRGAARPDGAPVAWTQPTASAVTAPPQALPPPRRAPARP